MEIELREGSRPIFIRPYSLPFAMKEKVEQELNRLVDSGILKRVQNTEYGTPIVPIVKKDGKVRIAGNYKLTVNKQIKIDRHPIPNLNDLIYTTFNGASKFVKFDLSCAYNQIKLHENSKSLLNISTHMGVFEYQCFLPYGIASGPGFFQREMEKVLQGISGSIVFVDDILISGVDTQDVYNKTVQVLDRLRNCGLTLSIEKCQFFLDKIEFLGHEIDRTGVYPCKEKVKAILNAPTPKNVNELSAFLGLISFYRKFLNNAATILNPLYELLSKDKLWNWNKKCAEAFNKIKILLSKKPVLTHYDPSLPIKVTCDSSSYGVAAVLSHILPDGTCKPIAYASKSLTKAQKNYSQIHKEAYGIYYGVQKFYKYVYMRHFILETDNAPLVSIFGPKKGIPVMAASRLQRWALFLTSFDFEIKYCRSKQNVADGLSRLPLEIQSEDNDDDISYLNFLNSEVPELLSNKMVSKETLKDPILSKVIQFIRNGWPLRKVDKMYLPFYSRRLELSVESNCLLWGYRLIIPTKLRVQVLKNLHEAHVGIVRTKSFARSYVWWPQIDSDLENMIKTCLNCKQNQDSPPKVELSPWKYPTKPNMRIHADFLGPFKGHVYLIMLDAYSKWIEVFQMENISSSSTIDAFRSYFSRWGIPLLLVTDNGTSFCSSETESYLKANGVKHVKTNIYSPYSNGAAENCVKTFKKSVNKIVMSKNNISEAISIFLFNYRVVPHSTTNISPAELQIGRKLRTRLDIMFPNNDQNILEKQIKQYSYYKGKQNDTLDVSDKVVFRDYGKNTSKWREGIIVKRQGNVTYIIKDHEGNILKRHKNQIITDKSTCEDNMTKQPSADYTIISSETPEINKNQSELQNSDTDNTDSENENNATVIETRYSSFEPQAQSSPNKEIIKSEQDNCEQLPDIRRSNRQKKPVKRFAFSS